MQRLVSVAVLCALPLMIAAGCCQKESEEAAAPAPSGRQEAAEEPVPTTKAESKAPVTDVPAAPAETPAIEGALPEPSPSSPSPAQDEPENPETARAAQKTGETSPGGRVVKKGDTVKVLYRGTLDDGTEFDSSARHGNQPMEFEVGARQMIKGFDEAVVGMKTGEKKTVRIPSEEAYGAREEDKIIRVPKAQIPEGTDLSPGAMIAGRGPRGLIPFTVVEVQGETVVLDANHPLAGKDLNFEIEVVEVTPKEESHRPVAE